MADRRADEPADRPYMLVRVSLYTEQRELTFHAVKPTEEDITKGSLCICAI